ncbi:MAG: GNAT family N-acetyltransferase [Chitinophagaceae bacterium]|nr:GNAT family N-acetyltransferase [Chitinophagaceae bacterium]
MDLLAIAIAPGIAICLFILHRDAYNKEPKLELIFSFLLGVVSVVPAIFIERQFYDYNDVSIPGIALKAFIVVALTEEAVKYAVLRLYSFNRPSFDEPLDGIVYGVMVSMGFATMENIMYVQQYGMMVGVQRMFLAVPAHATFGVLMGYFVGKAKFAEPGKRSRLLGMGLLWATFSHGCYDFFLFLGQSPEVTAHVSQVLLILGAVVSLIISAILSLRHLKIHRLLSQQTYLNGGPKAPEGMLVTSNPNIFLRLASPKDISLIQYLAQQVWPQTYQQILHPNQIQYMMNMSYSPTALQEQMARGHFFFVVYNQSDPVGFLSVGGVGVGQYRLHKIYVLGTEQGKGTGRLILESIMNYLRNAGGKSLELNVNRNNRARSFYEKMGFVIIREEDINIGEGFFMNDFVMRRTL